MLLKRHARSTALLFTLALNACTVRERETEKPTPNQVSADPPPTITSAAAPAPTLSAAPPPPAPVVVAPAPKPVVVAAPAPAPAPAPKPVDTTASCRKTFAATCTQVCTRKVNASTTDANKRRVEQDICIGECARAAVSRCGS